jgi:cyclohexanecarboxylate-CoA ligase
MLEAAERYRANGWWREQTFLDDLRRDAREIGDKTVIVNYRLREKASRQITFSELARLTERFACALRDLGIGRGDTVAVQLPSWWELLPISLACARVGARFCPLMTIYRRYELEHMLRLTGARVCVTVAEWAGVPLGEIVAELAGQLPELKHVIVADVPGGPQRPAGTLDFADHFSGEAAGDASEAAGDASEAAGDASEAAGGAGEPLAERGPDELGPDDPFLILFTSGTTGEAKGVLHSQNTLYAGISAYVDVLGMDSSVVSFISHAATHYTGFVQGMLIPVMIGCTALVQDVWDPGFCLDLAERHRMTALYGSPPYLAEVLEAQRAEPRDVSSLSTVVTGSAPVPPHIEQQVRELLGTSLFALWGMSENGPVTMTRPDDPPGWAAHSDGRPIDCMQIRIEEAAVPGASEGSGKLWVRGACQCLGYYKREADYAAYLDSDGWFDTGDLARDDGRGGMRISGRVKDIVINRGFNVPVAEVEGLLVTHPKVKEVAVIAVPDRDIDELVCAVVVPAGPPPTLQDLRDHMAGAGVTSQYWPERIELVDALPRTITGKVRKVDLRKRFGAA